MSEVLENRILSIDKSDWTPTKLLDLAEEISERADNPGQSDYDRFVGLEHFVSGDLKIKNWGSTKDLGSSMKVFKAGDVLFARRNAYLRRASLVDFDGICSGDAFVLRENHKNIVPGFLAFVLNSDALWDYANSNAAGTMSKRVKWRDLGEYEFLLPPKDQQACLAELLWAGDKVIEKYEELKLEANKTLNALTSDRFRESKDPITRIKDISTVQAGATPLRAEEKYFNNGSIPWLKTLDLNDGEIFDTEEKITELAIKETSCKVRNINTVLVAMYGGFNQIGRTGLLRIAAATNQAVCAIQVDQNLLRPEYLQFLLNAKVEYWKKVAISSRKDPNITKQDVENFPFCLPSIVQQDKIVLEVKSVNNAISRIQTQIQSSKQLQKSLINQIF